MCVLFPVSLSLSSRAPESGGTTFPRPAPAMGASGSLSDLPGSFCPSTWEAQGSAGPGLPGAACPQETVLGGSPCLSQPQWDLGADSEPMAAGLWTACWRTLPLPHFLRPLFPRRSVSQGRTESQFSGGIFKTTP